METPIINILMVDDRPENLQALEAVLDSSKYQLVKANSGEEALKWVLKKDFAVILLDVQMPGLDGFETAKLIRARKKSQEIPIIFITALSQTQDYLMSGYSVGAIDFMFKPYNPYILKSKVEGFVKIYLSQWQLQKQNEIILKHSEQLDKAYLKLQKSEEIFRAVSETSTDTIFTMNKKGEIISANPAATMMFGYEDNRFPLISEIVPIFQSASFEEMIPKKGFETEAQRNDQSIFPIDIQLSSTYVNNETIYVCTIRDITERKMQYNQLEHLVQKRTEELLIINEKLQNEVTEKLQMIQIAKDSEYKYRQLVEESPETIIVLELDQTKWSYINRTGVKLLGGEDEQDILSKDLLTFIHPDYQEIVKRKISDIKAGKKVEVLEEKFVRLDGETVYVEVSLIPFVYMGKPAVHIVARDITDYKKTQEYIRQSEKLAVVGELAAGIAHEVRNPLTSLRGFAQLLQYNESSTGQYVPIMLTEIDRINTIVSELLLLAKPKQDDFNSVNVRELLDAIVILMNAQAIMNNIEIKLESTVDVENSIIDGLENKLKQVFINLIVNAIEAMPDGGNLKIQISREDDHLSIEFQDEGCGIPAEHLSKIGKPFFTTKEKGTGLGLMVCHSIIESHGGTMMFKSDVGKGTTITLRFPALNLE